MRLALPIILISLLSSCYTYKVYPKAYRSLDMPSHPIKVYVENPSLKKEYKILRTSGLFEFTDLNNANITIHLDSLERFYVCGQPLIVSAMTLGQLPIHMPDRYIFRFEERKGNQVIEHTLELQVAKRIWYWDLFNPDKSFDSKAGTALLGAYHSKGGGFGNITN